MVRVNPNFDEPIRESMLSFLVGMLNKIDDFPEKNPDQIILDRLEQYYKKRKAVKHSFSEDLIEIIRDDYILDMIDNNKEDLEKISQTVKNKLVTFFIDFFIDRYFKNLDVYPW